MIRRVAVFVLTAQVFALAELGVVLFVEQGRIASVWESHMGAIWLAPTLLVAAALVGAFAAFFDRALFGPRPLHRLVSGVLTGVLGLLVGYGVGGGRHLEKPGIRLGFALLVAALGVFTVLALRGPAARLRERRPLLFSGLLFAAGMVGELVNRFVLVRLYPAFHAGLGVLSLVFASLALGPFALKLAAPRRPIVWLSLGAALLVVLALAIVPSARRLAHFDNFRLVLLDAAPLAGQAVALAAFVSPPPPWQNDVCADAPDCAEAKPPAAGSHALDLRGRDILLVTIDALRADHVGAYGYRRPTTPNIDKLAQSGVVFEHAYTPTPHTSYAVTSLMTGKYMRPLLLQGMGADSDTFAGLLRTYGYRTAAFYPPAVFFIDAARFKSFSDRALDFEYRWVEFTEGPARVAQVERYLSETKPEHRLFLWVHLFAPHEPYEAHPEHPFGDRDVDRYDAEVAFADATLGAIVKDFRRLRPSSLVMVTADHGEEFGDHGGHYHGTTVYEEQVRVPLVVAGEGLETRRVREPVSLVDLLPTVLAGLEIPRPPRLRGRDLGPLLVGKVGEGRGLAYAETEQQALLASGPLRLLCQRRIGACELFDLAADPGETQDKSAERPRERDALRKRLAEIGASHGRYEVGGLRAEGKGWPAPIRRALAGDGDAAPELAELLEDADLEVRKKAAELLFELRRPESAPALRLSLAREENAGVRAWEALALTRLGQGAPLVAELLDGPDRRLSRLAALALGEAGDRRGEALLVAWWQDPEPRDFERSRQILEVFGALRTKSAVWPLVQSLSDVRLRPYIARVLARIGDDIALNPLLTAFADERLSSTRVALAEALVELGAREELAVSLRRFLGVPDPLPGGLAIAERARILEYVGGPKPRDLTRLRQNAGLGQAIEVVVPVGDAARGLRVLVRAKSAGPTPGEVIVQLGQAPHHLRSRGQGQTPPRRPTARLRAGGPGHHPRGRGARRGGSSRPLEPRPEARRQRGPGGLREHGRDAFLPRRAPAQRRAAAPAPQAVEVGVLWYRAPPCPRKIRPPRREPKAFGTGTSASATRPPPSAAASASPRRERQRLAARSMRVSSSTMPSRAARTRPRASSKITSMSSSGSWCSGSRGASATRSTCINATRRTRRPPISS